ncbi:TetR/AcrR family transcriptional regulator [Aeromicrobium sp. YIM 150415]|uniref:TetR/AcrR family transcriptional regulator n=1 Tax=Aeromicrobium sp. YIM 150415 TaxID=2803912 RepID=UPI0019627BFC|nr:TetR/AcrR family transcriptional regulator [Aeromicrobium sp. YIM 150415]MBM9465168.1 TetR/AcrR family transcriptional regulator [Aeromicrobium sp. YIM 150415]
MPPELHTDTRTRLLNAAAEMIAASPGEDVSLRAICAAVGVKMPTLYHFFGSKRGLIEAVIERGFDMYLEAKASTESSGDPIQDIRAGWDAHVAFGLENPGFYTLMYGTVQPGYSPAAQSRPSEILRSITRQAAEQGRLVVTPEQAAAHVLVANIGVTLRQIVLDEEDRALSVAIREGVIAAITGAAALGGDSDAVRDLIERAAARPEVLGPTETRLFIEWAQRLDGA